MKNINQNIAQLITENNCVVVPGFGGFVGTYQPASLDVVNNTIKAPHKVLIFNQNLSLNDGLLIQSISKNLNCNITEAIKLVDEYVLHLKNTLNQNQRVEIDSVGFLFLDEEKQIKFVQNQQHNLLKSSFGLSGLKLKTITPAINESPVKTQANLFTDRRAEVNPTEQIQRTHTNEQRKINYKLISTLVIIPILAGLIWIGLKNNINNSFKQQAGLNPLQDLYTPIDYNFGNKEETNASSVISDSSGLYELKITDLPNVKPILVKVSNEADSTRVEKPEIKKVSEANFGIIAGCFSNPENADNYTNQLKAEGYHAVNTGIGANGLNRVVFGKFNSRAEAYTALSQIKAKYPNAWISQLK